MSALGQKQTCASQKAMSALPPIATAKADIGKTGRSRHQSDVRFTSESGHVQCTSRCPLCANSGHWFAYSITSSEN